MTAEGDVVMEAEQLLSDRLVIEELTREARRRGYFVLALSQEEKVQILMYLCGVIAGIWIAGGLRG